MPCRAFNPPACCEQCGQIPPLGETLHHREGWLCADCLSHETPGKDATTKAAYWALRSESTRELGRQCKASGQEPAGVEYEQISQWHAEAADLLQQAANNRARATQVALGEAVPANARVLKDTLVIPNLAAIDASIARTGLLTAPGVDALALALDAGNSAEAKSSLEKMHLHQMAVLHKTALEQVNEAHSSADPEVQAKRLLTANRLIRTYQQGLLTLIRLRGGGVPIVQHLHISEGGQAVVGTVQNGGSRHPTGATKDRR